MKDQIIRYIAYIFTDYTHLLNDYFFAKSKIEKANISGQLKTIENTISALLNILKGK